MNQNQHLGNQQGSLHFSSAHLRFQNTNTTLRRRGASTRKSSRRSGRRSINCSWRSLSCSPFFVRALLQGLLPAAHQGLSLREFGSLSLQLTPLGFVFRANLRLSLLTPAAWPWHFDRLVAALVWPKEGFQQRTAVILRSRSTSFKSALTNLTIRFVSADLKEALLLLKITAVAESLL